MIKVDIKVETDCDFVLGFPKFIKGLREIKYDGDYSIKLEFGEETAKEDIIDFLFGIEMNTEKYYLKNQYISGLFNYKNQLESGLCSSEELLGGNCSFQVRVYRFEIEYL